ncbi:isoflavone reductase family protein [Stipitochalara longipes BDJ]|nr:isoflavone reductase family protein [Stipitochalara longipes BDJ]
MVTIIHNRRPASCINIQRVLLLGATGETGGSILNGLLDSGNFEITALVRPSSAQKPDVLDLIKRGVRILIADISSPINELVPLLKGFDIFISAISGGALLAQMGIVTAAKEAGIKRFVPCGFATICPPGGVMKLRDQKEQVLNHVKQLFLPYTFIDVGYWYQLSFPPLPSGKIDKYIFPGTNTKIRGDGTALNLITDLRDVGHFVARIVADERTLNRYVFVHGEELTEKGIYAVMEEVSGEELERKFVSEQEIQEEVFEARKSFEKEPENAEAFGRVARAEYEYSKYVRLDNRAVYARYLGYLDARELYPDLKPRGFDEFARDLMDGKVRRPYSGVD